MRYWDGSVPVVCLWFIRQNVSKFKMEAQAAARLSHPNIVNVYDVVDEGDLHYIVMELIEGITLKNYIEKKGFLENKEAIGIAIQVAQGIAAAHEQHIIHRDIKPQNMIISKDGTVKVADFGIARAVSSQTMNATAVGSVHYISPEQARGGYCDERSDIYSFGITLYEMVTGRVPFEGDNTVAVALAHLEEAVTPPSQLNPMVSRGLEEIILKCTQKKPDRRYPSIGDVITDPEELTLQTPESFFQRFRINMKIHHEVISIHPDRKTVSVKNLENGEIFEENYDKLILSPGAKPTQPRLPGVGIDKLFTFRTVEDTFRIKEYLNKNHPKTAGVLLIKHWIIIRM